MKTLFESNKIVVLKADKSQTDPEVDALLSELGNSAGAIPYFAMFQPEKDPVHFDGCYLTPGSFIDRLVDEGVVLDEKPDKETGEGGVVAELEKIETR